MGEYPEVKVMGMTERGQNSFKHPPPPQKKKKNPGAFSGTPQNNLEQNQT